ncbi:cell cycle exit and neuronal differentiation protein 1 [Rhinophrynus dorsalis]
MEAKPRSTSVKASKTEKGSPAAGGDKKEISTKEQQNPVAKKTVGETVPVNNDGAKPSGAESQGASSTSENKGRGEEPDTSNGAAEGSGCEGLKPLLVAAGVTVAAIAVIVGVVLLARKK